MFPPSNQHRFAEVPGAEIPRSAFDMSHRVKTTFDGGYLIPIFVEEALPGDTFNVTLRAFARLATPLFPIMDDMRMSTFFFSVPMRLLWDNWERFMGAQDSPADPIDYLIPEQTSPVGGYLENTLADYLGLPIKVASLTHSAMFHRAYALVWNEWYRDENLQDSVTVNKGDGPDAWDDVVLMRRGKRKDYFTSALPWPQKGNAVELSLGASATVTLDAAQALHVTPKASTAPTMSHSSSDTKTLSGGGGTKNVEASANWTYTGSLYWVETGMEVDVGGATGVADLSTATPISINALREAVQTQRLLERDARGGTRYVELLLSHFGVHPPDYRLQRPEYLGGGITPVNINPVAQTSETGSSPQGNLAAFGTASIRGHGFTKSFDEHCIVLGLVSVQADLSYQQGLARKFSRSTRYDYYWPVFAHLGEQAILNKEIYCQADANDDLVFGYQERWGEYRFTPNRITGLFRSDATGSLDAWTLAQDFTSLPVLNDSFIQDTPPIDRVIATPTEPHFLFDGWFQVRAARPMPVYSVPGMVDHF